MLALETHTHHTYARHMTLSRSGWLMSWLSVIALILTVAMPQRVMAAPMMAMMQTSHCTDCGDEAPMPGKATGHQAKALPCSPSMCVGVVAAVLPVPTVIKQPIWRPTVYAPSRPAGPSGRQLAPDPLPPRPSVQA